MASIETRDGRTVHYDERGSGPTLILVSGLGGVRGTWVENMEALARHFRVIAVDNRDAGDGEEETEQYSIADMADDVAGLLNALGIERAHIAGISMGGFIAQHLALDHPGRVDRLILVATSPAAGSALGQPFLPPERSGWIADPVERGRMRLPDIAAPGFFDTWPGRLDEMAQQGSRNRMTWEGYARQVAAIDETHDVRARLQEITAPTLIIHGDQDPLISPRLGALLGEGIPNARLLIMPGVGHLPPREAPDAFNQAVLTFLGAG